MDFQKLLQICKRRRIQRFAVLCKRGIGNIVWFSRHQMVMKQQQNIQLFIINKQVNLVLYKHCRKICTSHFVFFFLKLFYRSVCAIERYNSTKNSDCLTIYPPEDRTSHAEILYKEVDDTICNDSRGPPLAPVTSADTDLSRLQPSRTGPEPRQARRHRTLNQNRTIPLPSPSLSLSQTPTSCGSRRPLLLLLPAEGRARLQRLQQAVHHALLVVGRVHHRLDGQLLGLFL